MEERDNSTTVKLLIFGLVIWFVLASIPVLIFVSDKLKGELGLFAGVLVAAGMAVSMNISAAKSLHMERHQSSYLAWSSIIRLVIVGALIALFGFTGWINIITMLIGIFGLKVSAYIQPLLIKILKK